MEMQQIQAWATIAKDSATAVGLVIGGVWAIWKFVLKREAHAKIQFSLELNVLGELGGKLLVEAIAVVENKGLVRHDVSDFRFDLHYLPEDGKVIEGDERINRQVLFQPVIKKRYWIPPDWIGSFVDPGVIQRYTYVTFLPKDAAYALVYAQFKYPDEKSAFHTAQRAFRVHQVPPESIARTKA